MFLSLLLQEVSILVIEAIVDSSSGEQQFAVVRGAVENVVVKAGLAVLDEGVHGIFILVNII